MIASKLKLEHLLRALHAGNFLAIARAITLVENSISPAEELLKSLTIGNKTPVIGITGPPGAGKSTLVNAIIKELSTEQKRIAVLAVDPTSPFNFGSVLGDRIRMATHFNNPNIFIRSIATRGSLGGLSAKTIEIVDVLKAAAFDLIIVETVGVGQSEIEIAGLADKTILVLVPEAGDEIQHIKSGLMEVAQAFVVNKADREGANTFANTLSKMVKEQQSDIPIFKTVADKNLGVDKLCKWIMNISLQSNFKKEHLLLEQAYRLIQQKRMKNVNKTQLLSKLKVEMTLPSFNMYTFVSKWK